MLKKLFVLVLSAIVIAGCNHGTSSTKVASEDKKVYGDLGGENIPQPVRLENISEYVAIGTAYEYSNNNSSSKLVSKDGVAKKVVIVGLKADGTLEKIAVEHEDGSQDLENIISFTKLTDDYSFITISNSPYTDDINPYNTSMFTKSTMNESDYLINMNSGKMHELKWVYAKITKDLLEANGLPYKNEYLTKQSYFNGFDGIIRNQLIVSNGNIYVFAYLNLCNNADRNIVKGDALQADEWYKKGYIEGYNLGKEKFEGREMGRHGLSYEEEYLINSYLAEKYNCTLEEFISKYIEDLKNDDVEKYGLGDELREHVSHAVCDMSDEEILRYEMEHLTVIFFDFFNDKIRREDYQAPAQNIEEGASDITKSVLTKYPNVTDAQKTQLLAGAEKGYTNGANYEISEFYAETDDIISQSHFLKVYKLSVDESLPNDSETDSVTAEEYDVIDGVKYIRENKDHAYMGECGYEYYFQLLFANKTLENQIYWDMDGDHNVGFVYDIASKKFTTNGYANLVLKFNGETFEFGNLFDDNTNRRSAKGIEFAPFVYGKEYSRFYAFNPRFNDEGDIDDSTYSIAYGSPDSLPYGYAKLAGNNTVANIIKLSTEIRNNGIVASFVIFGIENNKVRVLNFAEDIDKTISFDEIKNALSLENDISSISLSEQNGQCHASITLANSEVVEAVFSSIGTVSLNDGSSSLLSVNQLIPTQNSGN